MSLGVFWRPVWGPNCWLLPCCAVCPTFPAATPAQVGCATAVVGKPLLGREGDTAPFLEGGGLWEWTCFNNLRAGEDSLRWGLFESERGIFSLLIRVPAGLGLKLPRSRRPFLDFLVGTRIHPSWLLSPVWARDRGGGLAVMSDKFCSMRWDLGWPSWSAS